MSSRRDWLHQIPSELIFIAFGITLAWVMTIAMTMTTAHCRWQITQARHRRKMSPKNFGEVALSGLVFSGFLLH